MVRVNVWVPDELLATIRERLPDLNVSRLLQDAMRGLLQCHHTELACATCAAEIDRWELVDGEISRFYREFLWRLEPLVMRVGTAEGAARIAKEVAQSFQLSAADAPLPRPSKANRERARDLEFEASERAMAQPLDRPHRRRAL